MNKIGNFNNVSVDNKTIAYPQSGMNRDSHPSVLKENEYTFALNANIESEDGNVNMRSNEHSNMKCIGFGGYKVVGYKNDLASDMTYFFLYNPSDGTSRISYMKYYDDVEVLSDEQIESLVNGDMQLNSELQILIEDSADDPCLNFSLSHPIKSIEIKTEKCGKCIYWTDGYNPPRYVIVDKALIPDDDGDIWYHYHGFKLCGDGKTRDEFIQENGCVLACEKLRVFPLLEQPRIEPEQIEYGGSLRAGVYQFAVALCDEFGNEKTNYSILTNPIHVFDKQYIRVKDGKWGERTNLGIRLVVSNIDRQASHFKIVVVQNTVGYNGETQPVLDYFEEGVHPVTEKTVYYYSDLNNKRTTFEHISFMRPIYNTSKGLLSSGNKLLQYGLTAEKEWNLQPVVSLMGHFLKWQASVSSEDLYKDGAACAAYVGYMRDEVYPFGIRFVSSTGYKTPLFTLIPPPYKEARTKAEEDPNVAKLMDSVLRNSSNCYGNERVYKWQYVNTASKPNLFPDMLAEEEGCKNTTTIGQTITVEQIIEKKFEDIYFVAENVGTTNLAMYISENMKEIACSQENNAIMTEVCEFFSDYESAAAAGDDDTLFKLDGISAPTFPEGCGDIKRQESILSIPYDRIVNPVISYNYRTLDEMEESSKNYIYTLGGEMEDKYALLFDKEIIEDMEMFFYENWDLKRFDNFPCDNEAGAKRYPENVLMTAASCIHITTFYGCSQGCSVNSPAENPTISKQGYTTFQPEPVHLSSAVYPAQGDVEGARNNYNCWCIKEKSGSEEAYNTCYKKDVWQTELRDMLYERATDDLSELLYNEFDTGLETDWIKQTFSNTGATGSPLDVGGTNPQFRASLSYCRFHRKVNKKANWIEVSRPASWDTEEPKNRNMFLEIFGKTGVTIDAISTNLVRISFWKDDIGTPLNDKPIDIEYEYKSGNSVIVNIGKHSMTQIDDNFFSRNKINRFFVSIDMPIVTNSWYFSFRKEKMCTEEGEEDKKVSYAIMGGSAVLGKLMNPYVVGIREKEVKSVNVRADLMEVKATVTFSSQCETCGDKPLNCAPRKYRYGDFAYWESSRLYPANYELYDSSRVKINTSRHSSEKYSEIMSKLEEYYGGPVSNGDGTVSFKGHMYGNTETTTVFCQQPIRHYKFPDGYNMPFMNSDIRNYGVESEIYPIGILIDESTISLFLDFAVDSGLITQEQRDNVVGYELYRGDRRLNRSVVATGVGYDMFKYIGDTGDINLYSSYPYNSLGDDIFNYNDATRTEFVKHPFDKNGNVWYTFHSPDIHFNKPELPTEVVVDGYQRGMSIGGFAQVQDHPKWVILGPRSYQMASTLANIEATAQIAATIANELMIRAQSAYVGLVGNLSVVMLFSSMAMIISQTLARRSQYYGKYRYDWLNTFVNNGPRKNYAWYYTSVGHYNSMTYPTEENYKANRLRGLSTVKYILSGIYPVSDVSADSEFVKKDSVNSNGLLNINNIDRESCIFLSMGNPGESNGATFEGKYLLNYPQQVKNYDNSRFIDTVIKSEDNVSGESDVFAKMSSYICSPYMKLFRYRPDQYGDIEDINWISIGGNSNIDGEEKCYFGGDIYISRFSLKRKVPMFYNNAFRIGDMIPFAYYDYRNISHPRYFINYDTGEDALEYTDNERFNDWTSSNKGTYSFYPNRCSLYEVNGYEGDKYVNGRFYLWFYGIPQFLVESEINCNYRLEGEEPHEWFYPAVGDYLWWTQEKNVSIQRDNTYRISPIYSSRTTILPKILPATYERRFYDCAYQRPNGVIWSVSDVSENSQTDPWLTYKPLDYHEFRSKNGSLIHMKGMESEQIMVRFEDQVAIYNAIDVIKERLNGQAEMGSGGLFASRPMEYNTTDLGYSGTQSTEIVSSEFGHFWVDVKRAQVFMTDPNGRNLKELSVGIRHWLKKHLPFKILKYGIINKSTGEEMSYEDVDNKFIGLGLSLGWDNRYKRLFITKKDYVPTREAYNYTYQDGKFYYNGSEVSLRDTSYFENVSFTIGYSCLKQEWISYYSFCPDYYVEQQGYFLTGLNYPGAGEQDGLWSHLLTNKSFQTYYGTTYPFILEVPLKEKFNGSILSSVEYELDARKYVDDVNYTLDRKVGLDSIVIYNDTNNTGEIRLVPENKNDLSQKVMYPKTMNGYTEVLDTEVYRRHKLNDFFNRVDDDRSETPIWIKDKNDINKEVDSSTLNFRKPWLDRLRGSWLLMRLKKVIKDRKIIFQWAIGEDKQKNR